MTNIKREAESCLVAICAHLSMTVVQDENFPMWVECLRAVLPDCDECSLALADVRVSANLLVEQKSAHSLTWLRRDVFEYYRLTAAKRFEALQEKHAESVIEAAS